MKRERELEYRVQSGRPEDKTDVGGEKALALPIISMSIERDLLMRKMQR